MKRLCLAFLLVAAAPACAQDETFTWEDVAQSAEQWAQENLDPSVLRTLQSADQEKVQEFLNTLQKEFHGEYIIDLAPLRETAKTIEQVLESHEDTVPLAVWLKTRLDYFDVANEIRLLIPPPTTPPKPAPSRPVDPSQIRNLWMKEVKERPMPEPAAACVTNLKPIFVSEQVPPELVWVAEVESSFDVRARSPAGAAGLFQLMPSTAKQYGLKSFPFDQRLKPEDSAHAAAKHMRYLRRRFGDWRLAMAAYNAGEGTVQKLLDRYKATSYDTIAPHLPAETQLYVPKVEATLWRREEAKLASLPFR
jgi:membrane-bound lytic murein transglycosylase D